MQEDLPKESSQFREFARQYVPKEKPEEESFLGRLGRGTLGLAARSGEAIAGIPGALHQLAHTGISKVAGLIPGVESESVFDWLEGGRNLPTPEEIRKFTKKATGEYLEPRAESEKIAQETMGDIATFLVPGGGLKLAAKIGIPITAQIGKQTLKHMGFGDTTQDLAKIGVMGAMSMAHLSDAKGHAVKLMHAAEEMVPPNATMNPTPVAHGIEKIKNQEWYKGAVTPSKRPAIQMVDQVAGQLKSNKLDVKNAIQMKKDINELLRNLGSFEVKTKPDIRSATKYLNQVKDSLDDGLEAYGRTNKPFWNAYKEANKAYAVTERSSALSNYIQKHYSGPALNEVTKALIGLGIYHGAQHAPQILAAATPLYAAHKTLRVLNRISKSPAMRKYYANVLSEAAKGNAASMSNNLSKLNQKLKEEEAKEPLRKRKG